MNRRIICTNENNIAVRFDYDFSPFFLKSVEGIYGISANVTTSENTTIDGSTYQGSTAKERNIVITAQMEGDYKENRNFLYRVFKLKSSGVFTYMEDGDTKQIEYKVESIEIEESGVVRDITISLICPKPFFEDLEDVEVVMASWVDDLEFPVCFPEEGIEFGHREANLVKEIENNTGADNIGIMAVIRADGPVKNPAIHHAETEEYTKLEMALESGQIIVVTTGQDKKKAWLLEGVSQSEIEEKGYDALLKEKGTNINEYLSEGSRFIQLQHGKNTITYTAEMGANYMSVSIFYRLLYLGV